MTLGTALSCGYPKELHIHRAGPPGVAGEYCPCPRFHTSGDAQSLKKAVSLLRRFRVGASLDAQQAFFDDVAAFLEEAHE